MNEWLLDDRHVLASDGLPARLQGRYAAEKLEFLDRYLSAALSATRTKRCRVFLDLFAGPGMNRDEHGVELDGSPMRAIRAVASQGQPVAFTEYFGINLDATDDMALKERVALARCRGEVRVPDVHLIPGDANDEVPAIMRSIATDAYVCAYLDPESPSQLRWTTLEELRRRHWSTDLYLLFPLEMGWNRLFANWRQHAHIFRAAIGDDSWLPIVQARITDGHNFRARAEMLKLYLRRLGTLWKHVTVERAVARRGDAKLYRMIFATNHPAGLSIAEWASKPPDSQLGLKL